MEDRVMLKKNFFLLLLLALLKCCRIPLNRTSILWFIGECALEGWWYKDQQWFSSPFQCLTILATKFSFWSSQLKCKMSFHCATPDEVLFNLFSSFPLWKLDPPSSFLQLCSSNWDHSRKGGTPKEALDSFTSTKENKWSCLWTCGEHWNTVSFLPVL